MREMRNVSTLYHWHNNPRTIEKHDFERLKRQVLTLGQYKPLIITQDGEVLGGNMRLDAYLDLGIKDVWVSVVNATTDKEKLEYALSDNDRAGNYDENKLHALVLNTPGLELDDYKIDLGRAITLTELHAFTDTVDTTQMTDQEFKDYLEAQQDKDVLKILTTVHIADEIRSIIVSNSADGEDEGATLLRLLKE